MIVTEASYEKYLRDKSPAALKPFIRKMNQVLNVQRRYADAYVVKGNLQAALQDYEVARKSYSQAAKLVPRAATCYLVAVTILQIQDPTESDLVLAREYLTQIIDKKLRFPRASAHLAGVYDKWVTLKRPTPTVHAQRQKNSGNCKRANNTRRPTLRFQSCV
jgi:tetratricopeptide (TPR) repeat protein